MSRIGREPVIIPQSVKVELDGQKIIVSGNLGKLEQIVTKEIKIERIQKNGKDELIFTRTSEDKAVRAKHGLFRALVASMIKGVEKGFEKTLVVNGVGFKVQADKNVLTLNIGFSHSIVFPAPADIKITCPSATEIKVSGFSKEKVGQVAADIRALRPVEPYHAYGIRYSDEKVRRKEGKKAAKKK